MSTHRTRVLVVDDNEDLASVLESVLSAQRDMECVGRLGTADALLQAIKRHSPDVVLLDLTMPGKSPMQALEEVAAQEVATRVLVMSGHDDPARADEALQQGAWGYVTKRGEPSNILTAIRVVAGGDIYLHQSAG